MCCPLTKHLLPRQGFQHNRLLSLDVLSVECRDVNSYVHKLAFSTSAFKLPPKGKCKYMAGYALAWKYLYLSVHWYVAVRCVCGRTCALLLCMCLWKHVLCLCTWQYTSRNVQGRLDLCRRGVTENPSGNLLLQLKTLELYQSNLSNSALWKMLQRTNPFLSNEKWKRHSNIIN